MMLEWMGVEDPAADRAGKRLREVVAADLAEHGRERRATGEIGDAIVNAL
jgi:tartrate dehydrogenase/decarboxylase/D-malate dehydrogenase